MTLTTLAILIQSVALLSLTVMLIRLAGKVRDLEAETSALESSVSVQSVIGSDYEARIRVLEAQSK